LIGTRYSDVGSELEDLFGLELANEQVHEQRRPRRLADPAHVAHGFVGVKNAGRPKAAVGERFLARERARAPFLDPCNVRRLFPGLQLLEHVRETSCVGIVGAAEPA
jgi:hypothetical protein